MVFERKWIHQEEKQMTPLRQRMLEDMKIRNFSPLTMQAYISNVARFAKHFGRSPEELGTEEIRSYQLHLVERGVSFSTYVMAVCSLRFLYTRTLKREWEAEEIPYPRRRRALPVILSQEEVAVFLESVKHLKYRTIFTTIYATGLRLSEAIHLRVSDIDSSRMVIHVRDGKGKKDRYVMLSQKLLEILRNYWREERPSEEWLFPRPSGGPVTRKSAQKCCTRVSRKLGWKKRITSHLLRHCFATHLLESGVDVRTIQILLGHASVRTTQRYTQISEKSMALMRSPLDMLPEKTA